MDISTILGLIGGILVLWKVMGNNLASAFDGASLLIVGVGGISATLIAYPLWTVVSAFSYVKKVFVVKVVLPSELIKKIVGLAETARREGILALEQAVAGMDDAFGAQGMRLAIDGTAPELIHVILETELSELAERHKTGQEFFKDLGLNWIAFGFIGSMAVIAFRSHSAESLSSLAAVAALPLFYSFVFAGLIAFPFRRKLARRSQEEILQKRMILTGIAALQIGDNPRIVEQKLTRYVASKDRYVED